MKASNQSAVELLLLKVSDSTQFLTKHAIQCMPEIEARYYQDKTSIMFSIPRDSVL